MLCRTSLPRLRSFPFSSRCGQPSPWPLPPPAGPTPFFVLPTSQYSSTGPERHSGRCRHSAFLAAARRRRSSKAEYEQPPTPAPRHGYIPPPADALRRPTRIAAAADPSYCCRCTEYHAIRCARRQLMPSASQSCRRCCMFSLL